MNFWEPGVRRMAKTVPLKVTAHIFDGRIASTDGVIMLDSVLYHGWFYKYDPKVLRGEHDERKSDQNFGLPLTHLTLSDGTETYCASRGIYKEIEKRIECYNKRPDFFASDKMKYLNMKKGLISDSVGAYRAYRNPLVIRVVQDAKIEFYCKGTKPKVEELLKCIPSLVKKPSMGWGAVEKWDVEEVEEDYSLFHPEYGLMRPIPVEDAAKYPDFDFSKYPVMLYGVKPPYWKPCNARPCYIPVV